MRSAAQAGEPVVDHPGGKAYAPVKRERRRTRHRMIFAAGSCPSGGAGGCAAGLQPPGVGTTPRRCPPRRRRVRGRRRTARSRDRCRCTRRSTPRFRRAPGPSQLLAATGLGDRVDAGEPAVSVTVGTTAMPRDRSEPITAPSPAPGSSSIVAVPVIAYQNGCAVQSRSPRPEYSQAQRPCSSTAARPTHPRHTADRGGHGRRAQRCRPAVGKCGDAPSRDRSRASRRPSPRPSPPTRPDGSTRHGHPRGIPHAAVTARSSCNDWAMSCRKMQSVVRVHPAFERHAEHGDPGLGSEDRCRIVHAAYVQRVRPEPRQRRRA